MVNKSIKVQTDMPNMASKSEKMQCDNIASNRSSSFWGLCCESGKKYSQIVKDKIHITMASLDSTVVPTSPVVSLMVDSAVEGGKPYIVCNLKPGSLLQVNLNLLFDKGEKVTFSLRGQGQVHLSGYHVFDKVHNVSSESPVKDLPASPIKDKSGSPSKVQSQAKKKSKDDPEKLTNVKGTLKKTITALKKNEDESDDSEDDDDDDFFEELEDSSEDEESEESDDDLKNDSKKLKSYKRLHSSINPSDPEDDDSDSDESEEDNKKLSSKKMKKDVSFSNKKAKNDTTEVIDLDDEPKSNKKTLKTKNDLLNSSIGHTPMPRKKNSKPSLSNDLSPKKVTFDVDEETSSNSDIDMDLSQSATPNKQEQLTPPASESKKKRKKKKKAALNASNASDTTPNKTEKAGLASATYSQKLPGGVEYEDIRPGNGPLAKKGRLVHVYYTGMLENNKVFDSREIGNKPFSFKLGADQVIKGWDVAIEGMKVGGKRRMKIPASLGYKNQRMGPIPPNSTLYFNVELKAVS